MYLAYKIRQTFLLAFLLGFCHCYVAIALPAKSPLATEGLISATTEPNPHGQSSSINNNNSTDQRLGPRWVSPLNSSLGTQQHSKVISPASRLASQIQLQNQKSSTLGQIGSSINQPSPTMYDGASNRPIDRQKNTGPSFIQDRIEGSGNGQPNSGSAKHNKQKFDDTEDGEDDDDDDETNDEDYDSKDSSVDVSDQDRVLSNSRKSETSKVTSNNPTKITSAEDIYRPFRPPILGDIAGNIAQQKPTISSLTTAIPITTPTPYIAKSTTTTTRLPSSTIITGPISNMNPPNNKPSDNNHTKLESDYDYEDEGEDEDSEDTSMFEDGESIDDGHPENRTGPTTTTHKPYLVPNNQNQQLKVVNSVTNTSAIGDRPTSGVDKMKPVVMRPQSEQVTSSTFKPLIVTTTIRPMISRPATSTQRPDGSGFKYEDVTEEENEDEDGDEDEESEAELDEDEGDEEANNQDDNLDDDNYEEERLLEDQFSEHRANTSIIPSSRNSSQRWPAIEYITTSPRPRLSATEKNVVSVRPTPIDAMNPSVVKSDHVSLSKPQQPSISTEVVSTTTVTTPAPTSSSNKFPSITSTATPTTEFTWDSTARNTAAVTVRPILYTTTARPREKSIISFDRALTDSSDESLTRQLYLKLVEVYQDTDKTIRSALSQVWPADFDWNANSLDPLFERPMFFMLALAGTVIGLVLTMMLVVYIIAYQIQPKYEEDDDVSIY